MQVTILTASDSEYMVESDTVVVRKNGLVLPADEGATVFFPWSHIKVIGVESDDADAVAEFFYNF